MVPVINPTSIGDKPGLRLLLLHSNDNNNNNFSTLGIMYISNHGCLHRIQDHEIGCQHQKHQLKVEHISKDWVEFTIPLACPDGGILFLEVEKIYVCW